MVEQNCFPQWKGIGPGATAPVISGSGSSRSEPFKWATVSLGTSPHHMHLKEYLDPKIKESNEQEEGSHLFLLFFSSFNELSLDSL